MGHCRIISHISGVLLFQALIGDEEEDAAVEAAEEGLGIGMPAPCRLADVFFCLIDSFDLWILDFRNPWSIGGEVLKEL